MAMLVQLHSRFAADTLRRAVKVLLVLLLSLAALNRVLILLNVLGTRAALGRLPVPNTFKLAIKPG